MPPHSSRTLRRTVPVSGRRTVPVSAPADDYAVGARSVLHRRVVALPSAAAAATAAIAIAGCGGASHASTGNSRSAAPVPATGPVAAGRQVFASAGCASCHTLAAANASGTVGPNLDSLKPTYAAVVRQVTNGGGGMPAFGGQLSATQITDVAKFVATVTRR